MSALNPLAAAHYFGYLCFSLIAVATLLMELGLPRMRHVLRRLGRALNGDGRRNAATGATVHRLHRVR